MPAKNKTSVDDIVVISSPLSAQDERLNKLFDEIEGGSLATLEDAARQIITLSTALLGAFFGLLAFKDAPAYLGHMEIKVIGAFALIAFLLSLFLALRAVSPRRYDYPRANLTAKRRIFDEILTSKHTAVRWASGVFGMGAFLMLLAALDILIFQI